MAEKSGFIKLDKNGCCGAQVVADLFGVGVRRVQQMTHDGILHAEKTGKGPYKYDFQQTIREYVQYLSDMANGRSASDAESSLKEQKLKAEIALKESQGELHKLKTDIAAGRYISVDEVERDYRNFFTVFKKFALAIPAKAARVLSGHIEPTEVRSVEKELSQEIVKMLRGFVVAGEVSKGDGL